MRPLRICCLPDDRDDARRPNRRQILGAKYYLADVKAQTGTLAASSSLTLDDGRVNARWFLWEGERPAIHSYAKKPGYIAIRYGDELFELTSHKAHFRWFGIAEAKVQQNLTIVLEPQLFDPQVGLWGIHPDQSRNRLNFTGNGDKGVAPPLSEWGLEFAENMPDEIREAIRKARGDGPNSLEDEEYRRRLQDKFGSRWRVKQMVQAKQDEQNTKQAEPSEDTAETDREVTARRRRAKRKHTRTIHLIRLRATEGGSGEGVETEVAVDVPKFRFAGKDEFDHPWHLALWLPHDPDGPTVLMNDDSPILAEAIRHHQGAISRRLR
jgi:hypothetical protein